MDILEYSQVVLYILSYLLNYHSSWDMPLYLVIYVFLCQFVQLVQKVNTIHFICINYINIYCILKIIKIIFDKQKV